MNSNLENLADLSVEDVLSQHSFYTSESFEEKDGMLIAETLWRKGCGDYSRFIVGKIEGHWERKEVRHQGKVVAINERNTGWGFVTPEMYEA